MAFGHIKICIWATVSLNQHLHCCHNPHHHLDSVRTYVLVQVIKSENGALCGQNAATFFKPILHFNKNTHQRKPYLIGKR